MVMDQLRSAIDVFAQIDIERVRPARIAELALLDHFGRHLSVRVKGRVGRGVVEDLVPVGGTRSVARSSEKFRARAECRKSGG